MAKEWECICKNCGKGFGYSDWSYRRNLALGQSRMERCPECRKEHNQRGYAKGQNYFKLHSNRILPEELRPGILGMLNHPKRPHVPVTIKSGFDPDDFGVTDENIRHLFAWFSSPEHQVAVVVAPTGSGKSTALPDRLINPPQGIPADYFSRYGQILVTQPRTQATRNIPAFVAEKLHGSHLGAGYDIGFRHKNNPASDRNNRLVYATDGTLINWIVDGQIANLSVIMIDEAHERSLNIDLILGLLKRSLPLYPHLKLIIASATIDTDLFLNYFGSQTATLVTLGEKRKYNVLTHFANPSQALNYENVSSFKKDLPQLTASKIGEILKHMEGEGEYERPDFDSLREEDYNLDWDSEKDVEVEIPEFGTLRKRRGHILAFLQGEKPIDQAVAAVRQIVASQNILGGKVDVFPLYTSLPQEQQDDALLPGGTKEKERRAAEKKRIEAEEEGLPKEERERRAGLRKQQAAEAAAKEPERVRVIISTNVAETSLTVEGVYYVVETGIINQADWNSEIHSKQIGAICHSRAGCKQRWGRAGRISHGEAYCLYTKKQFRTIFPKFTIPQIERSDLEQVLLTAKKAGIDSLDEFDWIQRPKEEELSRLPRVLKEIGALDEDGDLTERGSELQSFSEAPGLANLMVLADQFSCAVEMAPWVAMMSKMVSPLQLLINNLEWDDQTTDAIRKVQRNLFEGCQDDLDFCLKVYYLWSNVQLDSRIPVPVWALKKIWPKRIPRPSSEMLTFLGSEEKIQEFFGQSKTHYSLPEYKLLLVNYGFGETCEEATQKWLQQIEQTQQEMRQEAWCLANYVNHDFLKSKIAPEVGNYLQSLMGHKKDDFIRPLNLKFLNRIRILMALSLSEQVYYFDSANPDAGDRLFLPWQTTGRKEKLKAKIDVTCSLDKKKVNYFVCGKQNVCTNQKEELVGANYTAILKKEWFEWLNEHYKPSSFEISLFFQTLEKDAAGQSLIDSTVNSILSPSYFPTGYVFTGITGEKFNKNSTKVQLQQIHKEAPPVWEKLKHAEYEVEETNGETANGNGGEDELTDLLVIEAVLEEEEDNYITSHEDPEADFAEASATPPLSPNQLFPFPEINRGGVLAEKLAAGNSLLVKGMEYQNAPQGRELFLATYQEPDPFSRFQERFAVGDQIKVKIKNPNWERAIEVWEETTDFQTQIAGNDLIFTRNSSLAGGIFTVGEELEVTVLEINGEYEFVRLSTLPQQEKQIRQYWEQIGKPNSFSISGLCVANNNDYTVFRLQVSEATQNLYLLPFSRPKNTKSPYSSQQSYPLTVHFPRKEIEVELTKLPGEVKQALTAQQEIVAGFGWQNGKINIGTQPISFERLRQLKALCPLNNEWQTVTDQLYLESNRLFYNSPNPKENHSSGQPKEPRYSAAEKERILQQYAVGKIVTGKKVLRVGEAGIDVQLEPGLKAFLHQSKIKKGQTYQNEDLLPDLKIIVAGFDENEDRFSIKVDFAPQKVNRKYQAGEWVEVTIKKINPTSGLVVQIPETSQTGFIFYRNTMKFSGKDWVQKFAVEQKIHAKVLLYDEEKHFYKLTLIE